ncbi:3-hydroxyanthranilate 3,4-dioxygenase-like isoform X2 [Mya arenaria]|nr:3-hydroxyanthranilate 3,4-dioxygenase-like isoform X2 [Mya arenaria]XP_052769335.1 3-hydroxyanthranilate 3,4-dioxygenase-like isoform X2 [Mya arenaria]XP_052769336.1 3-hydroxyanthranilate 3,4-dioxygenase-like isoform X2 [Mya arenaria]XP_052769338.1 3-hydroxyanthranilate 3,4-dioxygenase-like isoform X2 [Mya arenaria]XP_052769339.1 3-hydroxyanthranilate 3,4-dioxygenase-like isoform X2 [Mya arenaria]XP_052769340.1 3-hydroxyanthranilate 3,4-dioxygenase-like isoform X2 [Mya arenaria]XP_05276934
MAASTDPVINNTDRWIEENKKFFLPPVCNKMMHQDGQMKSFYVGGPNQRKDYHIEEGEELFYMVKGDMCLKVVECGKHKDVVIKEGEIFLLPGSIAHSPQRQADTVGLVIERERSDDEKDGLRYFIEADGKATLDSLYEEWFHCEDLGSQLGPIIKRYFASEQHKTGKPVPGTIPEKPPVKLNPSLTLQDPFNLNDFIKKNRAEIDTKGFVKLFQRDDYTHQFQVFLYGKGDNKGKCDVAETFIWVLEGQCEVTTGGKNYTLGKGDNMLIRQGQQYSASRNEGSMALICYQDPTLKKKVE